MIKKRIIACLDVKNGEVIKGINFKGHEKVGDIVMLAKEYSDQGIDELVFYDISASCENRVVSKEWIKTVSKLINIPLCVAGGIKTVEDAKQILENGADKISINSPALNNPNLIKELSDRFGKQCVVVGIDSYACNGDYYVYKYTGDSTKTQATGLKTLDWAREVERLGAGEIVLNCINKDGVKKGYDIEQTELIARSVNIPVVASGGAGKMEDFLDLFSRTNASSGLAASIFHKKLISIKELKMFLIDNKVEVRKC